MVKGTAVAVMVGSKEWVQQGMPAREQLCPRRRRRYAARLPGTGQGATGPVQGTATAWQRRSGSVDRAASIGRRRSGGVDHSQVIRRRDSRRVGPRRSPEGSVPCQMGSQRVTQQSALETRCRSTCRRHTLGADHRPVVGHCCWCRHREPSSGRWAREYEPALADPVVRDLPGLHPEHPAAVGGLPSSKPGLCAGTRDLG